jgi:hypothetical protein
MPTSINDPRRGRGEQFNITPPFVLYIFAEEIDYDLIYSD